MVWYQKAAAGQGQGAADAMGNIGALYRDGDGVAKNYQQAMAWALKGAEAGCPGAMTIVGFLYNNGLGVATNRNTAIAWYRAAASAGDSASLQWLQQNGLL